MAVPRDNKGRFIPGVAGNPNGRKPRAVEDDFLLLIDSAVSSDDWRAIIAKANQQAQRGDHRAREWLADRRFGKARERVEQSGGLGVLIYDVEKTNTDPD
jgi:hypothetical protein